MYILIEDGKTSSTQTEIKIKQGGKDSDSGRDWGQEEKGTTEDKLVGWHHRLDGHGFGWTLSFLCWLMEAWSHVGQWLKGGIWPDLVGPSLALHVLPGY